MSGTEQRTCFAARHEIGGDTNRRSRLAPQRCCRSVGHADDVRRLDDGDRQAGRVGVHRQRLLEHCGRPDQRDLEIEVPRRRHRAIDDHRRRVVAAHRIDRDTDHVNGES